MPTINLTPGDDSWFGTSGNDSVSGGLGNDFLFGNAGDDTIYGDDGDDILSGGQGNDLVDGGAGNDILLVRNDYSTGSELSSGDQFIGGTGLDLLRFYGDFTAGFTFDITSLTIGADIEQIRAELPVTLTFSQLGQFSSASGIFNLVGSGTLDLTGNRFTGGLIIMGSGDDTVTMAGNTPTESANILGGAGNDHLIGSEGGDSLSGGEGSDRIEGGGGNDTLSGGAGADILDGGAGNDELTGGSGADTFVIGSFAAGSDVINDFALGVDKIDFQAVGFQSFGDVLAKATQSGDHVIIEISPGQTLTLQNIELAMLAPEDFIGLSTDGTPPPPPSIIPALPTEPNVAPISEIVTVTTDGYAPYTVAAGQTVYATDLFALFGSSGSGFMSPLTNNGTVWNEVSENSSTLAVIGRPNHIRGVENNGVMVLHLGRATTINAFGFQETTVNNSGEIYIINEGTGNAWLTSTFLTGPTINSGLIVVQAQHGFATGYEFMNEGSLDNQAGGEILVEGMGAIAFYSRFGSFWTPTQITNAGVIAANSLDPNQLSFGLYLAGGSAIDNHQQYHVVNSGLIAADVAIYGDDDSYTETGNVIHRVQNLAGGEIHGLIYLQRGDDRLDNAGLVAGDVYMGDGNDVVDTSSGTIVGLVDLGDGNDSFIGSAYSDEVYGGDDNDVISGNGGDDFLEGGAGDDAIDGGSGFDMASYWEATAGVTVSLTLNGIAQDTGGAGVDTLISIEDLLGSNFDDHLIGSAAGNILIGGGGDDILSGGASADLLEGGAGNDLFRDTAAGLNGDTIIDFHAGDSIHISDATLAGFAFNLTGNTLTYTGGSLTLQGVTGRLVAQAAAGGGVELVRAEETVRNDFNGDGRSDILWRSDAGEFSNWLGTASGGFVMNDANAFAAIPTDWKIAGTGDFNGDGYADVLWRHDSGAMSNWLGNASGGFSVNDGYAAAFVPTDWQVAGTGDFNGDGYDDILWRNDGGAMSNWLGNANGGFASNDANAFSVIPTDWHIVGTGDFNGDGRDDILWRSEAGALSNWLATENGGFTVNDDNAFAQVPTDWHIAGTGDFNGDGRDDILWRSDGGALSNWLGTAGGGFAMNDAYAFAHVPASWQVVAVGDYNGDGYDDILWRSETGDLSNWLGTESGGFTVNDANAFAHVPTSWHVQPADQWL